MHKQGYIDLSYRIKSIGIQLNILRIGESEEKKRRNKEENVG